MPLLSLVRDLLSGRSITSLAIGSGDKLFATASDGRLVVVEVRGGRILADVTVSSPAADVVWVQRRD